MKNQVIETAWGKINVHGRIGQGHADVLEAIMFSSARAARIEDGRIKLLVDPAAIRRVAGIGGAQLKKLLTELMSVVIELNVTSPEPFCVLGHLIDAVTAATTEAGDKFAVRNPFGGDRVLWRVELGTALVELIDRDVWINYNPTGVARLTHGVSQALARHILTHKYVPPGGWKLDGLIKTVAGQIVGGVLKHRRAEVRADAQGLKNIGIEVVGDRVTRSG